MDLKEDLETDREMAYRRDNMSSILRITRELKSRERLQLPSDSSSKRTGRKKRP